MFVFDLGLAAAVGASAALVGRRLLTRGPAWRAVGLWTALAFEVVLHAPASAYLTLRFPGWRLLSEELASQTSAPWFVAAVGPIVAAGVFLVARRQLLGGRPLAAWLQLVAALLLVGVALADGLGYLPLTADLRPQGRELQLAYLAGAAAGVLILGWFACLWRLFLLERSSAPGAASPPLVSRDGRTKPVLRAEEKDKGASARAG